MSYQVIRQFRDLQDEDYIYNVGDTYPRKGRVKKARVDELSSTENKIGVPLIEEIEEGDK